MLTERRKADREKMADYFYGHWVAALGFTAERIEPAPTFPGERCIMLKLTGPRGVSVHLEFDGNSCQPDTHVISWNIARDSDALFAWDFAHTRNEYHKRKATDVVEGFEALRDLIGERISQLQSGDAFEVAS